MIRGLVACGQMAVLMFFLAGCVPIYVDDDPRPRPRPRLKVWAKDDFRGSSTVFDQRENDLARSGWNDRISSLEVQSGEWEVCKRTDYRSCRVLRSRQVADLGDWDDAISSLRPIYLDEPHDGGGEPDPPAQVRGRVVFLCHTAIRREVDQDRPGPSGVAFHETQVEDVRAGNKRVSGTGMVHARGRRHPITYRCRVDPDRDEVLKATYAYE